MNLVPTPDALPAGPSWFRGFLLLLFPLHLLFMNGMLGFISVALLLSRGDDVERRLSRELAKVVPFAIAFAVNFGVAALLFLQALYGNFFYTSSILMAAFWISVVPLLITAYYAAYAADSHLVRSEMFNTLVPAFILCLFLGIAFIFTNNMTLMLDPGRWVAYFANDSGTLLNMAEPSLLPRYLHMVTGGIAVGGLVVVLYAKWREKSDSEWGCVVPAGFRLFKWLTLLQLPLGVWLLLVLPRDVRLMFMGRDPLATTLFALSLLLMAAGVVAAFRKTYLYAAAFAFVLVFVMAFMRDLVRSAWIGRVFGIDSIPVVAQYSPLVLFLVTLFLGVPVVIWLLAKAREGLQQR